MNKTIFALLLASASSFASAGQYFSVDAQRETMKYYDDTSSQSIVSGTYSIDANDYVRLNLSIGTSLADDELRVQTDTFRQPSSINTVSSIEYRTAAEVKSRASLSAALRLPVSSTVDAVGFLGVSTTKIAIDGYSAFTDNKPTSLPSSDWSALNECELTGIESRCSEGVKALSVNDSTSGAFYAIGLDWKVSNSTTLFAGYRHEGDSNLKMSGVSLSLRFSLQ